MVRDIKQKITIETSLKDGISKNVKKAAAASTTASRRIDKNVRKNITMFRRLGGAIKGVRNALLTLKAAVPGLAALTGILAGGFGFLTAARAAAEFSDVMTEVSTLVDVANVDMDVLREGVIGVSNAFGVAKSEVGKGLYQTISSGAVDARDSIGLLTKAQKLATVGVASTTQAVDILTTAINAYGFAADQAGRVSDVMFETVKQGKTTIPELAQNIGRAIPLAATLGVTIEELGAATAAMTKGGIATDQAIVSLRGTMAALLSPTTEAAAILEKAGIDISTTAFKTTGLVGILGQLGDAFGNQPDVIAAIIPNIRALTGVLALVGNQANEFRRILDELENSGGATEEAFGRFMEDPAFRAQVAIQNLKNAFGAMGDQVINSFNEMIERGGGVERVAAQLELAGKGIGAAFGAMTKSIGEAIDSFADFTDELGGAEKLGNLVQETFLLIGDVIALGFKKLAQEVSRVLSAIVGDLLDFAALLGRFGVKAPAAFDLLAASGLGLEVQMKKVSSALSEARTIAAEFEGEAGKTRMVPRMVGFELRSFSEPTEGAGKYADALREIKTLNAQMVGLNLQAQLGLGPAELSETDRELARVIGQLDKVHEKWSALGDDASVTDREINKLISTFSGSDFNLSDDYFGNLFRDGADAAEEMGKTLMGAFADITPESLEFGQRLMEIKWALEGNEQAMLDYEIAMLRAGAVASTTTVAQIDNFNKLIDRIKAIKQEQLDTARSAKQEKFVDALVGTYDKLIDKIRDYREGERALIEEQARYAQQAKQVLADLGRANATTFEARLGYERELLSAQRERTLEMLKGMEGFEAVSQKIADAYQVQLDKLDPEKLTGFTGLITGSKEALKEFVIFVKDDAAFAFDSMTQAMHSFSLGFGAAFVKFASGAKSASAAFSAFARSFILSIAEMFAQRASAQLLGFFMGSFNSGGGGTGSQGPFPGAIFATGGIAKGGLSDLHAYASGGAVVKKPHVALVGEGKYNEAIVPLPDGNSIPVDLRGSGGSGGGDTIINPTINFSVQSLDPRGTVEVLLEPEVQKSIRAAIADSLISGSDAAFSSAVKGV